ncbi:MAG: TolC family protein [Paludibaculum sp.]
MALVLTLVVTPVAYTMFDDMGEFFKRRTRRKEAIQPITAMLLILLLVGSVPLRAQQKPQDLTFPQNAELTRSVDQVSKADRVGVSGNQRTISVQDAVQMALKNNLEIELERTTVSNSVSGVKGARGAFDSVVLFSPSLQANNSPAASSLAAANGKVSEHYLNNNLSVKQKTPWQGLSFHVDFDNQRQSTNNPFVSLNPNFTSRLTAGFSMPLWRYRDLDNDRAVLEIGTKQKQQSETDFETRVIDVVARTQAAYWDLAAAIEDAVVAADGVRLARDQHERNQRQISAGTLASVELAASEAELQRRIDNYVTAIGVVTATENYLKVDLTAVRNDPLWNERLMPSERTTLETPVEDLKQALTIALEKRTELRSLELRTQQNDVQKDLARSGTKPQVNLNANYINSGLAGTVPATSSGGFAAAFGPLFGRVNDLSTIAGLPPLPAINVGGSVPGSLVGGYGQNLSNLFSGNYQSVQAGLTIEWNPRNRAAEAQFEQTAIAEKRLKLTRLQLEQGISAQVRNSLQALETARQRMEAARAAEKAASEKLDSEIRLFQTGESTNFLVLTRQNELLDTRRRLVGSFLLRNKAVARLQQVLGTTLEANKVELH